MKNKFVLILLTVAIFIPSIVSVVYYNKANGGAADTRNTLSVTMKDIAGNTFVFDRNDGEILLMAMVRHTRLQKKTRKHFWKALMQPVCTRTARRRCFLLAGSIQQSLPPPNGVLKTVQVHLQRRILHFP